MLIGNLRLGVLVAGGLAALACGRDPVPPDLLGTWTTEVPPHAGHYLRIDSEMVELGERHGPYRMYPIADLRDEVRQDGRHFYTIEYTGDEGDDISLHVELVRGDPATLRLGHRSAVWTRVEGEDS